MHGAKGGAPRGERNGRYRTGHYTKEAIEERRAQAMRDRETMALITWLKYEGERLGLFVD